MIRLLGRSMDRKLDRFRNKYVDDRNIACTDMYVGRLIVRYHTAYTDNYLGYLGYEERYVCMYVCIRSCTSGKQF